MAKVSGQLSFFLFESTSLSTGVMLDSRFDDFGGNDSAGPAGAYDAISAETGPIATNFRLIGDRRLANGWKARARDNIDAVVLSNRIAAEDRAATPGEQEVLSRFTGFGATELADTMFRRAGAAFKPGWEDVAAALEALARPDELASLARATQYAHYTPEFIIRAIWEGLNTMGFTGGNILEPGCGTGLFFSLMPETIAASSRLTGIEMDPTTARIARLLFPNAQIRQEDFTKARLSERYHLVLGNPPFSDRKVKADDAAGKLHMGLHDYFIARSIERLLPGGIAAFVTSRYTMDKSSPTVRAHIAEMANLVAAIRLPRGAMAASAGTDVVVDILIFQKRKHGLDANAKAWMTLREAVPAEDGDPALEINEYFIAHPEMVLGRHALTSSAFGPAYTCLAVPDVSLSDQLSAAVQSIAATTTFDVSMTDPKVDATYPDISVGTAAEGATIKEGSYLIHQNVLMQIIDGGAAVVPIRTKTSEGIPAKHARIIRHLIPIRDNVREILRAQEADRPWGPFQVRLRAAYNSFVRAFGPINLTTVTETIDPATGETRETYRYPNISACLDDPDIWLIASIESYDIETGQAKQGPIFTDRVIQPPAAPIIHTAADALAVTLHEIGHVDLDHIAELLGCTRDAVIADLGDTIYLNPAATTPEVEAWETADAYLSGPVRTKLVVAKAAAGVDPRYARNLAALERGDTQACSSPTHSTTPSLRSTTW